MSNKKNNAEEDRSEPIRETAVINPVTGQPETDQQRDERLAREADEARMADTAKHGDASSKR